MKKPSLLGTIERKPSEAVTVPKLRERLPEPEEAHEAATEAERIRVVVRLNIEAVEALEDVTRQLRRETGRSVPLQRLMEEAVEDVLRKYGRAAVVLPAPTKRSR